MADSRKRNRDDEDDKKSKVDPQAVPDPETVKDWTDESIQAICNESFIVTEEIQGITLNPCKLKFKIQRLKFVSFPN